MEVNQRLKEIRKLRGLTQAQIAEKMGMAQSNFAVWETGKVEIPLHKLNTLAELLEVSVGDLLGISEYSVLNNEVQPQNIAQEIARLQKLLEVKEEVIQHREREEKRIRLLAEKLLSALHVAYQSWYLNRVPSKRGTLDKAAESDVNFWLQFFSIEPVKTALEMSLLPNTPFQGVFEKYKHILEENANPYTSRSSEVYEAWLLALDYLQKDDAITANKQLEKLNYTLENYMIVIMEQGIGAIWQGAFEASKKGNRELLEKFLKNISMYFQDVLQDFTENHKPIK